MSDQGTVSDTGRDGETGYKSNNISRRRFVQGAAAIGGLVAAGGHATSESGEDNRAAAGAGQRLRFRGINYDVGTNYRPELEPAVWHSASMRRDVAAIRDELHCNSIGIHGTDLRRLQETAATSLEHDMHVWIQPRLFDSSPDEMLGNLSDAAEMAEDLRSQRGKVVLNIGCETSLFTHGFIPGESYLERIADFRKYASDLPQTRRHLNEFLKLACEVARAKFKGPVTYGSGSWEWDGIEWGSFDYIGLDHYLNESNATTYAQVMRNFDRFNRPVVVLEFGCCTYEGAEKAGGMGWDIIDYSKPRPEVNGSYERSEHVQSQYISQCLDIFQAARVEGAFVYLFANRGMLHSADPRYDLDMASYGVVKLLSDSPKTGEFEWAPKLAYPELGRRYGHQERRG